jgi:O-Antigen ligase
VAAVVLLVYAAALAAAAVAVWRRPLLAVYAFVVGLALHNAVMAGLFALGVRGDALTAIAAWKETLLAVGLGRVALEAVRARRLPFRPLRVDALALAFAAFVLVYAALPQDWLDGEADAKTILYAARHALACVAAYFLGRALVLPPLRGIVLATAAAVAAVGVVEVYTVPIDAWEDAEVPEYFSEQLGFAHHGPRELPENFVFNTGDEDDLFRRAVSTFLSPLGTAYMLVVALCLWAARPRIAWPLAVVAAIGLLFTFTRAALLALAGALLVLAFVRRLWWPVLAAAATLAVGIAWTQVFPVVAPETTWSQADLEYQRKRARELGVPPGDTVSVDEPSIRSHLNALRDGVETVAEHPEGYGLGNAGATALRRGVPLKAGESTYTELGVETGVLGALAFIAWNLALLWGLIRRGAAGTAAAFAAVLALAVQTDVLGTPWLAYVVWLLAGARLRE